MRVNKSINFSIDGQRLCRIVEVGEHFLFLTEGIGLYAGGLDVFSQRQAVNDVSRFDLFEYLRLLAYIGLLVATVGGLPVACAGFVTVCSQRRAVALAWLGSLVFFYLFWAGGDEPGA